jgi:predicted SAM-dependent methyltransferase
MNYGKCPVCLGKISEEIIEYHDYEWQHTLLFDALEIRYCYECGFGFSTPDLALKDIERFYSSQYRQVPAYFIDYKNFSKPFHPDYRSVAQLMLALQFCTWEINDVFLDVGPGTGASFNTAHKILKEPNLGAIEYAEGAVEAYQKQYHVSSIDSLDKYRETFKRQPKIVLSSHSLEHFTYTSAVNFLNDLSKIIDPSGVFIAEVPHVDFRIHKNMRNEDSPHFLFFSKSALSKLFSENGFEVLYLNTCGRIHEKNYGQVYSDVEQTVLKLTRFSKIMQFIKYGVKRMVNILGISGKVILRNDNFYYGGDRDCLRIVARRLEVRDNTD